MFAPWPWRQCKSAYLTSPRVNTSGSDNSRAHAFLVTAPLLHTPTSTLCSTNLFLSCQDFSCRSLFNRKGHCDTRTMCKNIYVLCLCSHPTLWRPEYSRYMIEGTPGQPYGGTMSEFNTVESNMRKRRQEASSVLNQNETLCTVTSFPRWFGLVTKCFCPMYWLVIKKIKLDLQFDILTCCFLFRLGCPGFTQPEYRPTPVEKGVSKSLFFPDEAISTHPRFRYLHELACFHRFSDQYCTCNLDLPVWLKGNPLPFSALSQETYVIEEARRLW